MLDLLSYGAVNKGKIFKMVALVGYGDERELLGIKVPSFLAEMNKIGGGGED